MADDDTNNNDFQFQLDPYEDEEEALSLCDLPLDNEAQELHDLTTKFLNARRSSSEEFFEFFHSSDSFMCSADDIFVCGKLIPFKENTTTTKPKRDYEKKQPGLRRRSESLSGIQSTVARSSSAKNKAMMTNSRSLDYLKLQRQSSLASTVPDMERNSSERSVGSSKSDKKICSTSGKPKWSFLLFGIIKFPAEMDLSDIKSRQVRKMHSATLFPDSTTGKYPMSRSSSSSGNKGSWKLLKALSCKDHTSVAVMRTSSFYVSHV